MDKFIEMLKEKGIVERMQKSINIGSAIAGVPDEKTLRGAQRLILFEQFAKDKELGDAFAGFASEFALNAIIKELNIQPVKASKNEVSEKIDELFDIIKKELLK